jgi:hypothetical protein
MVAKFPDPPNKERADAMATLVVAPQVNAAAVVTQYAPETFGDLDMGSLATTLAAGMGDLHAGDMKRAEAMLYGQAHALQAIFVNMVRRAPKQDFMAHWESFMRVGLKAQNQCRMTLETLATIKNPPVVFVRQANIANGPQQVNNGVSGAIRAPAHPHAPAQETQFEPNRLLEASGGERLDFGAQSASGGTHQELASMGTLNGATHQRR